MKSAYVTLEEAAGFENISYKGIAQRINRNPEFFKIKTERTGNGGKERVLISLTSLSKEAQKRYYQSMKIQECKVISMPSSKKGVNLAELEAFVGSRRYKELVADAEEAAAAATEFIKYDAVWGDNQKKELADRIARQFDISTRTLYRYVDSYRNGGTVALIRLPNKFLKKQFIERPSIPKEVEELIRAEYLQLNGPRPSHIKAKVEMYCQMKELEAPGKDSIYRYIRDMNKYEPDLVCLAREGAEEYNKKFGFKIHRDAPKLANQVWEGDHHVCDFFIEYGGQAVRPWMTIWFDVCTRTVRGYTLAIQANGRTISAALRHGILKKRLSSFTAADNRDVVIKTMARLAWLPEAIEALSDTESPLYGMPQELYIDNGEDYKAAVAKGRKHKNWEYSSEVKSFCELTKTDKRFCTPYTPWAKGHCERWFGTFADQLSRYMPGYCGKDNKKRPAGLDEQAMARRGELLSLEEAYLILDHYIWKYHNAVHSSLGITPFEMVAKTALARTEIPEERDLDMCLMDVDRAHVSKSGISKFGTRANPRHYTHPDLDRYIGQDVVIRFDPNRIGEILVFDPKRAGAFICAATNGNALAFGASQDDVKAHQKRVASRRKALKQQLIGTQANTLENVIMERYQSGPRVVSGRLEHPDDGMTMITPVTKASRGRKKTTGSGPSGKPTRAAVGANDSGGTFDNYIINIGNEISKGRN